MHKMSMQYVCFMFILFWPTKTKKKFFFSIIKWMYSVIVAVVFVIIFSYYSLVSRTSHGNHIKMCTLLILFCFVNTFWLALIKVNKWRKKGHDKAQTHFMIENFIIEVLIISDESKRTHSTPHYGYVNFKIRFGSLPLKLYLLLLFFLVHSCTLTQP